MEAIVKASATKTLTLVVREYQKFHLHSFSEVFEQCENQCLHILGLAKELLF